MRHLLINLLLIMLVLTIGHKTFAQDASPLPDSLANQLIENSGFDMQRAKALENVIDYYLKRKESKFAKPFVDEFQEIAEELNNNYINILLKLYQGSVILCESNYGDAFSYLFEAKNEAMMLRSTKDNLSLQVRTAITLGTYYYKSQLISEAFESYNEALQLNKKLGNSYYYFAARFNISALFIMSQNYEEALRIIKENLVDPNLPAEMKYYANFNMGVTFNGLEKYDSAIFYLDSAYKLIEAPVNYNWVLLYQGVALNGLKDFDASINKLETCLDLLSKYEIPEINTMAFNIMCKNYIQLENQDSALFYADKCIESAKKYQFLMYEVLGNADKAYILHKTKHYEEAWNYLIFSNQLKDSLDRMMNVKNMDQQVFNEKIKNIEEEKKNENVLMKAKRRQEQMIMLLVAIVLVTAVVIVLLLLNRKNILLKNKKMQEETLTKELDLKNRELTAQVLGQIQRKELLHDVVEKLKKVETMEGDTAKKVRQIIQEVRQASNDDSHDDFDYYFVKTHPNFYDNLLRNFPCLTPNELRLCAYLKLNLSTKDIATICNISIDSAKTARYRLRKTFHLNNSDESFLNFFAKY